MDKSILNIVNFLYVIYDISTCSSYTITYKTSRANRNTNTNEAFRAEAGKGKISREVCQRRAGGDDALGYIKHDLLRDVLREDGCL
jgi:hypothetical protein